jgi:DNA-binding ferritin-like protein
MLLLSPQADTSLNTRFADTIKMPTQAKFPHWKVKGRLT